MCVCHVCMYIQYIVILEYNADKPMPQWDAHPNNKKKYKLEQTAAEIAGLEVTNGLPKKLPMSKIC